MGKYDHLNGTLLADSEWSWGSDRALLYAVGVGAGLHDPLEERQFTMENTPGLPQQVIPSFLTLMNLPSDWAGLLGWDVQGLSPVGVVHGEQSITLARTIPVEGRVRLQKRLQGVYDKGSGALLDMTTNINDATGFSKRWPTASESFLIAVSFVSAPRSQNALQVSSQA